MDSYADFSASETTLGKVETKFAMLLTSGDLKARWPGNECGHRLFVMTHDPELCRLGNILYCWLLFIPPG